MSSSLSHYRYSRRHFLKTSAIAAAGTIAFGCATTGDTPLIEILHLPKQFSRRADSLTANVSGRYSDALEKLRYRVNNREWVTFSASNNPRMPEPLFTLEMQASDLQPGNNNLTIEASPKRGNALVLGLSFDYQPDPVELPMTVTWENTDDGQLDVQDGYWETVSIEGSWRVRPKPGYENYDRLLNITGAFAGGRRVETSLVLRSHHDERLYGFGILPMWGGHVDDVKISPRRGWSFGIAWFYSAPKGVGAEFSLKEGDSPHQWVNSYRNYTHEFGVPYHVIAECVPEVDTAGNHLRYRQRMKWFKEGDAEPTDWITLTDTEGGTLPEGEYAVTLVAHRCQVEFGPTTVTALETIQVDG